jgi:NO-binding membrane sensor protein with MHYT domain
MGDAHQEPALRQLQVHWNGGLIAASIAVSLLGAFTSTQMMCQAKTARYFSGKIVWTGLGSLTFGFCSIWCLHFIAMLACELPLEIGLDVPLTILSAALAVIFTFLAFASDLLKERHLRFVKRQRQRARRPIPKDGVADLNGSTDALLAHRPSQDGSGHLVVPNQALRPSANHDGVTNMTLGPLEEHFAVGNVVNTKLGEEVAISQFPDASLRPSWKRPLLADESSFAEDESINDTESLPWSVDEDDGRRRRLSNPSSHSDSSSLGLPGFMSFRLPKHSASKTANVLASIPLLLYHGATFRHFCKGFTWNTAIVGMHYIGILALKIPQGHATFQPALVALSATIGWLVCTIGCILMPQIEVNLAQQLVFSVVAASGVAAKHFTGMWATTFWSEAQDTTKRGYPPNLAVAVTSIAILTCLLANGLLAHSATVARNKLAEVVQTKRKLWAAIGKLRIACLLSLLIWLLGSTTASYCSYP